MILKNKKVTVIGLGRSGFAAAKFSLEQKASVRVTDGSEKKEVLENAGFLRSLGAEVETGRHTEDFIAGSDLVVTSPGVPKKSDPLVWAIQKKIPVISEVELAFLFCKGLIVGVTGSNGKTTTSTLIHRLLSQGRKKSVLCGNVGYSFLDATVEIDSRTNVVLELSSFQLEDSPRFRPKIAVVLNIAPNHLDRHGSLENYARAKEGIFRNQRGGDFLVLNADDARVKRMAGKAHSKVIFFSKKPLPKGVFLQDGRIAVKGLAKKKLFFETKDLALKGSHNLENVLAAVAVAVLLKIPSGKIQHVLNNFKTLEHRIEPLGVLNGVEFFNDSKSTTVESTRAAILSMSKPTILIAGGRDKGVDFRSLVPTLKERVKNVILYGEAREKIAKAWQNAKDCDLEEKFDHAVRRAFRAAGPGDALLLSPMCTSFDQFKSFEERGEAFKKIFEELKVNKSIQV
jgi:UDP-N-acetylmuramoylalanine--D-glutamate ligase